MADLTASSIPLIDRNGATYNAATHTDGTKHYQDSILVGPDGTPLPTGAGGALKVDGGDASGIPRAALAAALSLDWCALGSDRTVDRFRNIGRGSGPDVPFAPAGDLVTLPFEFRKVDGPTFFDFLITDADPSDDFKKPYTDGFDLHAIGGFRLRACRRSAVDAFRGVVNNSVAISQGDASEKDCELAISDAGKIRMTRNKAAGGSESLDFGAVGEIDVYQGFLGVEVTLLQATGHYTVVARKETSPGVWVQVGSTQTVSGDADLPVGARHPLKDGFGKGGTHWSELRHPGTDALLARLDPQDMLDASIVPKAGGTWTDTPGNTWTLDATADGNTPGYLFDPASNGKLLAPLHGIGIDDGSGNDLFPVDTVFDPADGNWSFFAHFKYPANDGNAYRIMGSGGDNVAGGGDPGWGLFDASGYAIGTLLAFSDGDTSSMGLAPSVVLDCAAGDDVWLGVSVCRADGREQVRVVLNGAIAPTSYTDPSGIDITGMGTFSSTLAFEQFPKSTTFDGAHLLADWVECYATGFAKRALSDGELLALYAATT